MWQALRAEVGLIFAELCPPPWERLERARREIDNRRWWQNRITHNNRGWCTGKQREANVARQRAQRKSTITCCVICDADLEQPIGAAVPTFNPRKYCSTACKRKALYERRKQERRARRARRAA